MGSASIIIIGKTILAPVRIEINRKLGCVDAAENCGQWVFTPQLLCRAPRMLTRDRTDWNA
jgi:hypothetical protein